MAEMNVTKSNSAPLLSPSGSHFSVQAIRDIETPRRTISAGQYAIINPAKAPAPGSMVLVGSNRLEAWQGQPDISGVMVAIYSGESH